MIILTFPRSGSHYLRALMSQKLTIKAEYSHEAKDAKGIVITIARDPRDSLQSSIAMMKEFNREEKVPDGIHYYTDLYRFLYNRANIVIDYNTLITDPDKVINCLSDVLTKPIIETTYVDNIKDDLPGNYLVTSTTSNHYKKDHLRTFNLNSAYSAYNLLLSRKIV